MSQLPGAPSCTPKPKLLDQVREAIRVRHYSIRTEEAYVQWIRRFILFHDKRRPNEMGETEINGFLTHLAVENRVSSSTQNQAQSKGPLRKHLEAVKKLHDQELKEGFGQVYLPYALEVKYPNAHREWGRQYIFPAAQRSVDPRSGIVRRHHLGEQVLQRAVKEAIRKAGITKHASCHTFRHYAEFGITVIPLPPISFRKDTTFEPFRNSWGMRM